MKKFFAIAAMAAVTMSFISCEKEDKKNDGNGDGPVKIEREWRLCPVTLTVTMLTVRWLQS